MKVPKKSLILAGAALLCTGAAASAQKSGDGPVYRRVTEPLRPVSLNLETGTLTRGPKVQNKVATTCSSFNNNDFSGFVGVDTGANACEWWDQARKEGGNQAQRIGGKTGLMTGFSFAYCSAALDPASFGSGGSALLSFREGYEQGTAANSAGPTGTLLGTFALSGLPANTSCSSFFGGFNCYQITVTLGNIPLCFGGDGSSGMEPSVAWAWQFADLGTDGVLAKTFPFLSCVASCTDGPGSLAPGTGAGGNPNLGWDGTGMQDTVDQYCPVGTILSSFQFGTTSFGGYFTSISMDVREAAISSQANASLTTSPNNQGKVGVLTTNKVQGIGVAPSFAIDCSAAGQNGATVFIVGVGAAAATPSKFGTIWVPLSPAFQLLKLNLGNHNQGTVNLNAPAGAPKDLTLACFPLSFQGFCGDNPLGFVTNGQSGIVNLAALK